MHFVLITRNGGKQVFEAADPQQAQEKATQMLWEQQQAVVREATRKEILESQMKILKKDKLWIINLKIPVPG